MFHTSSPNCSNPTSLIEKKGLLDAVKKIWLKNISIPFIPGQIQFFTLVLYFLLIPSF